MLKRPLAAGGFAALALTLLPAAAHPAAGTAQRRAALAAAAPATLPPAFAERAVATGLRSPTAMAIAPDGRVFIAEQGGAVRLVVSDVLRPEPVVVLPTVASGALGLVGIAVAPDFAAAPALYLNVTVEQPARHNRIVRLKLDGDRADPETAQRIADLDPLTTTERIGGALHFGADGMLYVATGDNGDGARAPRLDSTHGKLLRFRPDGRVPEDNPYADALTGVHAAIWAIGLRDPATFAIQPSSGRMFVNDSGAAFEEVNDGAAGDDYGWPATDGPAGGAGVTGPIHSYPHSRGCAIGGGTFYAPAIPLFPAELTGRYFYADHCAGEIRSLDPANPAADRVLGTPSVAGPVDLRTTGDGALLVLARGRADRGAGAGGDAAGQLLRIDHVGVGAPTIRIPPADTTAIVGHVARFRVYALGSPPLAYAWRRDGAELPGATGPILEVGPVQRSDDGARFDVTVRNGDGDVVSSAVRLSVVDRPPPTAVIDHPPTGGRFRGDLSFTFAGHAVDADGATLPAAALTWRIDLHRGAEVVPILTDRSDLAVGSVDLDLDRHRDADFLRLHLTARDGDGLVGSTTRDVPPERVQLVLRTEPPGLRLVVDGRPITAPLAVPSIVGVPRTVQAAGLQRVDGAVYAFERWSDGGEPDHTLPPLLADVELTAHYRLFGGSVPIVDWGGDYVDADGPLRGADAPVDRGLDIDRDGSYDDARWTIPLSDHLPLSPPVDRAGPSSRFYGGLIIERYDGTLDDRWARVWAGGPNRPNDQLATGAGLGTRGWDLRYWRKDDFLAGGHARRVSFDEASRIEILGYAGGDGVPDHNSGRVRAVVRDGMQWYISQPVGEPLDRSGSLVVTNVRDAGWAIYEPEPPNRLRFKAEIARFEPHAFLDVQAVGYLHSNEHIPPPAAESRAGFAVERVRVLASLGADATARPPTGPTDVPGTPLPPSATPTASRTATAGPSPTATRTLRPGETPPPTDTAAPTATAPATATPPPGATTARPTAGPSPTRRPTDIGGEGGTIHLPLALRGASGRVAARQDRRAAGFVPRLGRRTVPSAAAPASDSRADPAHGADVPIAGTDAVDPIRAPLPGGRLPVLVVLRPAVDTVRRDIGDDATAAAVAKAQAIVLAALNPAEVTLLHRYSHVPVLYLAATARGRADLAGLPGVVAVEPDRLSQPLLAEHAAVVGADRAWADYGVTGAGVNVAVIDTGVQADHPDLRDAIVAQKCFSVESGCGPNSAASESDDAIDRHGHGTGVAGIIASRGRVAPRGIAPGAGIVAVRVFNADAQSAASDQIKAFDYLVRERRTLNVKIANMSLGSVKTYTGNCDNEDEARATAIQTAITRGIAVFVATGNVGALNGLSMPGCLSNVIAVAATYDAELGREPDRGGYPSADGCFDENASPATVACFSNLGRGISVVAPGIWTTTSALAGRTATTAGTSNAAPVAAAVGALVMAVDDGLRPAELKRLLEDTGVAVEARNGQRYPRVDAVAALVAAGAKPATPAGSTPSATAAPASPTPPAATATATAPPAASPTPPAPTPTGAPSSTPSAAPPTAPAATATASAPPSRSTIFLPVAQRGP